MTIKPVSQAILDKNISPDDISVLETIAEQPQSESKQKRKEMSLSEYELMMNTKTFNRTNGVILFYLSADGSDSSNMAFNSFYHEYIHIVICIRF